MTGNARDGPDWTEGIAVGLCARLSGPSRKLRLPFRRPRGATAGNFASICTDMQPFTNLSAVLGGETRYFVLGALPTARDPNKHNVRTVVRPTADHASALPLIQYSRQTV